MTIEKALEHFQYKFKNNWKPTQRDIEAFNSILEYKQFNETRILNENESLAKLWIHQLILMAQTRLHSSETAVKEIDKILDKSVYEWCKILTEEIPMIRFNSIGNYKYPLKQEDEWNITKMQERNKKIVAEFETELTEAMKMQVDEDKIIKFVEANITRIINKFEK